MSFQCPPHSLSPTFLPISSLSPSSVPNTLLSVIAMSPCSFPVPNMSSSLPCTLPPCLLIPLPAPILVLSSVSPKYLFFSPSHLSLPLLSNSVSPLSPPCPSLSSGVHPIPIMSHLIPQCPASMPIPFPQCLTLSPPYPSPSLHVQPQRPPLSPSHPFLSQPCPSLPAPVVSLWGGAEGTRGQQSSPRSVPHP